MKRALPSEYGDLLAAVKNVCRVLQFNCRRDLLKKAGVAEVW